MRLIDLTRPYQEGMPGFARAEARQLAQDGWNATTLTFYSHAGTHMDAPSHFGLNEQGIDSYDPDRFISKAWVIDATEVGAKGLISAELVARQTPHFQAGDSLLIRTDWADRYGSKAFRDELPRISESLARWCVDHQVNALGVEPPSVADVNNLPEVTRIHQILLSQVIIIEGLINLKTIQQQSVELMAFPLLIMDCDGAPARVMALEAS